jgi:hypothetical protein
MPGDPWFTLRQVDQARTDLYGLTLNMPPMTAAKKINAATKSNPVTIFLFRVTPGNCRRGSNLEDRIHPTLGASARKAISSV